MDRLIEVKLYEQLVYESKISGNESLETEVYKGTYIELLLNLILKD